MRAGWRTPWLWLCNRRLIFHRPPDREELLALEAEYPRPLLGEVKTRGGPLPIGFDTAEHAMAGERAPASNRPIREIKGLGPGDEAPHIQAVVASNLCGQTPRATRSLTADRDVFGDAYKIDAERAVDR